MLYQTNRSMGQEFEKELTCTLKLIALLVYAEGVRKTNEQKSEGEETCG
jgi:hypothetical protein